MLLARQPNTQRTLLYPSFRNCIKHVHVRDGDTHQMDVLYYNIHLNSFGVAFTGDNDDAVDAVLTVHGFSRVSLHKSYEIYAPFG